MPAATLTPDARDAARDTAGAIEILVDGSKIDDTWMSLLVEVQVRDFWTQPDMAYLRFHDPTGDKLDSAPLHLASGLQVKLGADNERTTTKIFDGEIVALEPEFREDGVTIAARALDKGHRFARTKRSEVYLDKTAADIVQEAISRNGLSAGQIQSTSVVYKHFQQSMESDWDLCWRLARVNGYEFGVDDGKVFFRPRSTSGAAATLTYKENLYKFVPRASAVGQVSKVTINSQDPKTKAATTGTSSPATQSNAPRIVSERSKAIGAFGTSEVQVADRVAVDQTEATKMADGALARNAAAFLEAEGSCMGSPQLVAGATITVKGVGPYEGDYVLSSTHHIVRGGHPYVTRFEITGDRPRTFAQLIGGGAAAGSGGGGGGAAGDRPAWASQLVLAYVTNNNDPENMGRVKVKYASLGDNLESEWARVATVGAGKDRGLFMLPQVNDSVIVGFEHGDPRRPFVLGTLYSGKEPLPADLKDGDNRAPKFAIKTPHQILAQSDKELKLSSNEKMTVEVKGNNTGELTVNTDGDMTLNGSKNIKANASQNFEVAANSSVKIKGNGSVEIEASGQLKVKAPSVSIEGSGMVEVKGGMIKLG